MKKIVMLFAVLQCLFVTTLVAQNQQRQNKVPLKVVQYGDNVAAPLTFKEKQQLEEVYGDKLEAYVLNRPQRLKDIKHLLRNRVVYQEIPNPNDQKPCPLLSEVSLFNNYVPDLKRDLVFNQQTFNPLKYNFNFYARGSHMYRVDNTNYFIIIKSQHQRVKK
ncbi:hypothetical protein [Mangrovimonas yunxiaonensis]|uniref:hypothetical protein n=1 Tax=Mangrovimonas yunxiaonensis TaxID=1197477 RepID=UPI00068D9237|nr:hypothetical protein [Mangrovimonas yunxiaonensis]GGH46525.1 hypothetical protein GCM10011364_20760 [Mangrovimonas yunxiaonensis]